MKLCTVIDSETTIENRDQASKVRIMNSKEGIIVRHNYIVPVNDPELSDILQHPENTNRKLI